MKERLISTVIIGWNGERTTVDHIFGSVLDQLLDQVRRMLWVCKVDTPIKTVRRIYFAIPPFATLEPGFMDALRSVMTLTSQIGAELTIIGIEERMARIRRCVGATPDALKCGYIEMALWTDIPSVIESRLTEDDLFILQSAREGTLSWRPGLDRLPGEFTSRYPTRRFIAVYPSESDSTAVPDGTAEDHPLQTLVEEAAVLFPTKISHFEELAPIVVHELHPKVTDGHRAVVRRLIHANDAYNSEIAKGVALVDMSDEWLDEPRLVVVICRNAITVPRTTAPVQVLVVVAHPSTESPAAHLERLNQLARRLRAPGLVDSLLQAKTVDRVIAQLRDGIQSG